MSHRNLFAIIAVVLVSFACYQANEHDPFLRIFQRTVHEIQANYVDAVDNEKLVEAGIQGMMQKLDENSGFNSPEKSQELQFDLQQKFVGIGIEVNLDPETQHLTVVGTLVDSPAFDAGVLPGDRILKINQESTQGFRITDAVQRIRGKLGESVELAVERVGEEQPLTYSIKRAEIRTQAILGDLRSPRGEWSLTVEGHDAVGYVRLGDFLTGGFGERTYSEFKAALKLLDAKQVKGLVLDLRGNPGGLLDVAIAICNLFVKEGTIVSLCGREKKPQHTYRADGSAPYANLPLVVLVDRKSASASEIVAACLQDHGLAVVGGERSYGKGTVQNVIKLEQDRSLKLTTAHFYRPSGKNIHRKDAKDDGDWGVSPSPGFEVAQTEEELIEFYKRRRARDLRRPGKSATEATPFDDEALKKAVEYLENLEPGKRAVLPRTAA